MSTRRRFLQGAAAGAVALPTIAQSQGVIYQTLFGAGMPRTPGGGVFFNSGVVTQQAPTFLSSAVDEFGLPKPTTLANLAGAGPAAFVSFYIHALVTPQPLSMPIMVVKDPSLGDIFRIDLWPPGTVISWWDMTKSPPLKTSGTFGVWVMRTFLAGTIRGIFASSEYFTILPRFNYALDQLIRVFYQWDLNKMALTPGLVSGVGNVAVMHNIKGDLNAPTIQQTLYGSYYPTVSGVYRPNDPIWVPWGTTLSAPGQVGAQPDYMIGHDPLTLTSVHGILGPITAELGRIPADPIGTQNLLIDSSGGFKTPPIGGIGLANYSEYSGLMPAIHTSGGPSYGGYLSNQGAQRVDTLTETINTGMFTPDGYSEPGQIPDGTADFFSSDD
jgi:hypothetical protein